MKFIRKLLFPFSLLYGFIVSIRNYFYDAGILKSYSFKIPVIAVGNLSTGGTGKTPQIEYLIRLLSDNYRVATLSRGYKRKSKGFILGGITTSAEILGDEPYQFYQKFPNIRVAVDANRKHGIEQLLLQPFKPQIVLLDDAFQHRKVKAGFYVLLTPYNDLYIDDFILPTGNLREPRTGAKRADVIVITKCPIDISENEKEKISRKLKLSDNQELFFTFIEYDEAVFSEEKQIKLEDVKDKEKMLLAGIANPKSFFSYLKNEKDVCLTFPDHHPFSDTDIKNIENQLGNKILITTEKDYVRLRGKIDKEKLFYLPIKTTFIKDSDKFDNIILDYIKATGRVS